MKRFEYLAPADLGAALEVLATQGERTRLLAGGTDLIVQLKNNEIAPGCLLDLKKIRPLSGIQNTSDGGLTILPLTTVAELESSTLVRQAFPVLAEAAQTIGCPQIRNRATAGGNLCRAAPSADLAPALIVLQAQLTLKSKSAERSVALQDFFIAPGETVLRPDEILASIRVPPLPPGTSAAYFKYGPRKTMDLAVVGAAVLLRLDSPDGLCRTARIALASVAPIPLRARKAEERLLGNVLTPAVIDEAAEIAAAEARPIADIYGPDWYKKDLVAVLVKRAIREARRRLEESRHEA